jgi:hypothetical protein
MRLWRMAVAAPRWRDKIRIWFMPAGWVPDGLPKPEKPDITAENQVKFRPRAFDRSTVYLSLQMIAGIALMIGVISNSYGWSATEKWLGAGLLWWQIINWSGILEAKPWVFVSELLRNLVTPAVVIVASELYEPTAALILLAAVSVFCLGWTAAFFRPQATYSAGLADG